MPPVVPSRLKRPRPLVLLLVGALLTPALLTMSAFPADDHDITAGAVCKNGDPRARKPAPPRDAPSCVNCRAPLLNAPLAHADRETSMAPIVALPPAA
jgi:hypothetical protein